MLLLIDNYDSFTCNIAALFNKLGQEVIIKRNDDINIEDIVTLSPQYIVIGPGPGRPENANISLPLYKYFAGKIPILGICLGHQVIAKSADLSIVRSKRPLHGRHEIISHKNIGIFKDLRNDFEAIRYNSLTIADIPPNSELEVTAVSSHGEIMGIRHKTLPVEGVQFHPESIFSSEGDKLFKNFLNIYKYKSQEKNLDAL